MRLISSGAFFGAHKPFIDLFDEVAIIQVGDYETLYKTKITNEDVILLGGGADIAPEFYGQSPSTRCGKFEADTRDTFEKAMFTEAKKVGAGMLGICRGAQLICALSGGSLIQHVNNHAGRDHQMTTEDGQNIIVCSAHHQMMNPFGTKHQLIGWASKQLSDVYIIEGEKNVRMDVEPEVVWFPESRGLAIQYHPEFMRKEDQAVQYSRNLVKKYFIGE